jgi:O-antigen ligase
MRPISPAFAFGMALLALAWLVPNHELPWVSFYGEACAAIGCMLLLASALPSGRKVELSILAAAGLATSSIPLLQLATGKILFAGDAWMASLYAVSFAMACVTGRLLCQTFSPERCAEGLACALVGAATLSVGIAAYQWLSLSGLGIYAVDLPPNSRPFGNLAQPNHLATSIVLGGALAIVLRELGLVRDRALALILLWFGFGVALSQSRTGLIQMSLLCAALILAKRRVVLKVTSATLGTALLATTLLYASWGFICRTLYLEPARSIQDQAQGGARVIHWTSLLDAISQRPITGYGWNQVSIAQAAVAASHPASGETIEHSHNLLLDLLVWNGIPVGLALTGVLVWWYWRHLRIFGDPLTTLLLAGTGVIGIHALLEYPLEYLYFLLPLGLMMGMIEVGSGTSAVVTAPRSAAVGLSALLVALMAWVAHDFVVVAANTQTLRLEMARIGTGQVTSPAPDVTLLTQQREFLRYARTLARPGMSEEELDWMDDVSRRCPYPPAVFRYALAAALNGRPEQAAQALIRLCKLNVRARCEEGREAWERMGKEAFPQIRRVTFPPPER